MNKSPSESGLTVTYTSCCIRCSITHSHLWISIICFVFTAISCGISWFCSVNIYNGLLLPFLEPFLNAKSLLSQSGSRQNLPPLISFMSLYLTTWYSLSSQNPASPTVPMVASKNSTKDWHNCFQMNDCMAAQSKVEMPLSTVCKALWFSPLEENTQEKISPSVTRPS